MAKSTVRYDLIMNGGGYYQMRVAPGYKFLAVSNPTDNTVEVYLGQITDDDAVTRDAIMICPYYSQMTIPIDYNNQQWFTFVYRDGGLPGSKKANLIFSEENLNINGILGSPSSGGSVTIFADGVGLAKERQLPNSLTSGGNLRVEVMNSPESDVTIVGDDVGLAKSSQFPATLTPSGHFKVEVMSSINVNADASNLTKGDQLPAELSEDGNLKVDIQNWPETQTVEVQNWPETQAVEVQNWPETQAVEVQNFPEKQDVRITGSAALECASVTVSATASSLAGAFSYLSTVRSFIIQANEENTEDVFIGDFGNQLYRLKPGDTLTLPISVISEVYARAASSAAVIILLGVGES